MKAISVVILTKNEESCIAEALESLKGWADEVIIADDESTDRTVEIARRYTDKVFIKKMDVEGRHRNWAYAQAKNDWVLSLDADEQASPELKIEIHRALANPQAVAFSIPLRNFIGHYWVKHGGWYPAAKVRLFRKDKFKYEEVEVHPRVFIDGECGHLSSDIIHKGYPDIEHFLFSVNRQSTLEARKWINTNRKMSAVRAVWRIGDRFLRRYLRKKAYKDGLYGFVIAYFDSLYQLLSYVKYLEMKKNNKTFRKENR
jgi:glycosyltransferase involved in cell wall biosynthesis